MDRKRRGLVEGVVLDPHKVGAAMLFLGSLVVFSTLFAVKWTGEQRGFILAMVVTGSLGALVRILLGPRMPLWTLHIDSAIYTILVSFLFDAGTDHSINFSMFYVWIAVYAALYFTPRWLAAHLGFIALCYGLAIVFSTETTYPERTWVGMMGTVVVISTIVAALVSALRRASALDPLTRLANRRAWDERLDEEMERARRSGQPLSLAVIDLDDFKAVNDRDGHAAGDALLRELAAHWRTTVRASGDFLARLGGDEFGLLAPSSDELGVRRLAARLAEVGPGGVTCSIGVATWDGVETSGDLFRRADEAMYQRKRERRVGRAAPPAADGRTVR
jgi:diguanylate cyclase (GGDEF)-like protein